MARTTYEPIIPEPSLQAVALASTVNDVVSRSTEEAVRSPTAPQVVVAFRTDELHPDEAKMAVKGEEVGRDSAQMVVALPADNALDVGKDRIALASLTVIGGIAVCVGADVLHAPRIRDGVGVDETQSCRLVLAGRSTAEVVGSRTAVQKVASPRPKRVSSPSPPSSRSWVPGVLSPRILSSPSPPGASRRWIRSGARSRGCRCRPRATR